MIDIHGKPYITVAERVKTAHEELKSLSITTEILPVVNSVVIKATVVTPKGTFTGISAANPSKQIEKMSPFEVAETSAIGRALGFAGYGIVEGIATADEVKKAELSNDVNDAFDDSATGMPDLKPTDLGKCKKCGADMVVNPKTGNVFCKDKCWLKE